ncbi:hypothetical protein [Streptomyces sp. NPDC088727]|uniref:hypothetical protein n=1 Tax=Streptomyces sp. NPDC088727 TaxID=3365875 RepID=UPI0037FBD353
MIAKTAHAATISRHLTKALAGTGITKGSYGYTVRQSLPGTLVEITWYGDFDSDALNTITATLDDRYDVTRSNGYADTAHPRLFITPGTTPGRIDGNTVTDDDVTHGPYAVAMEGDDPTTVYTDAETLNMIIEQRTQHGEATIDRTTGVITLHIGKTRTERVIITPATPEQITTQRTKYLHAADRWTKDAARHQADADRLRASLATTTTEHAHFTRTKIYTAQKNTDSCRESALTAQNKAHALTPTEPPVTTPAETVTVRVPGAFARAWMLRYEDNETALDAAQRDLHTAWAAAPVKRAGKGTVHVLTMTRPLAACFAAFAESLAATESSTDGVDSPDHAAGAAGFKMLARLAEMGIHAADADPAYTMADPARQAELEADIAAADAENAARNAAADAENARNAGYNALTPDERRAADARIITLAAEHLSTTIDGPRQWFTVQGLTVSALRGHLSIETRHDDDTAPLDRIRATLTAHGWNDYADNANYIYATAPENA